MAAQTHGAVDSLLGLLSSAIKDEAQLLGGVHGDVQFIRDEMDSMNGFLVHLTKTEGEHDDQLRAWMKQVRDIAYVAEDCIELYLRDLAPPGGKAGALAFLRHLPVYLWTAPARHRLATQIRELKVRVRDVGERRLRYGVNVPTAEVKPVAKPLDHDDEDAGEARREAFLQALEQDLVVVLPASSSSGHGDGEMLALASGCPSFSRAISLLPKDIGAEDKTIRAILQKCCPDDAKFSSMKMFLCALRVYPYATVQELKNLRSRLDQGADDPREQVRVFCYSRLSTQQKSCLQYLTAFLKEKSIARTSLVRRWVAEGLVAKEHDRTPEEVGERCFGELVFRGFVYPVGFSDAGTVKSCNIDDSIREFIIRIAKSENFVSELPSHLERQLQIRNIVLRSLSESEQRKTHGRRNIHGPVCCCRGGTSRTSEEDLDEDDGTTAPGDNTEANVRHPMDELVHFLKSLPEVYRLNVLDLGGCQGLKKRHIKSICRVVSLKYLSLRNTDVSRLRARHIQALRLLETLDIRETKIPPRDTKHIFLPKLKHLLAGSEEELLPIAVEVPRRIGMMRQMETLSDVQVSDSGAELEGVAKLPQLRKLGVVVPVNDHTTKHLCRVINGLIGLHSLSIWVTNDGTLDFSMKRFPSFSASSLVLENLDIKGKFSLPPWISQVTKLRNITLCGTDLKGDLLGTLGNVQGLRCLRLLRRSYTDQSLLNFMPGQFKALKFLIVEGDNITSIAFEDGAAPMLEKIVWTIIRMDTDKQELISGIQHLRSLKAIELRGDGFDPTHQLFANLKQAVAAHPNQPNFMCSSQGKVFEAAGNATVTVD